MTLPTLPLGAMRSTAVAVIVASGVPMILLTCTYVVVAVLGAVPGIAPGRA